MHPNQFVNDRSHIIKFEYRFRFRSRFGTAIGTQLNHAEQVNFDQQAYLVYRCLADLAPSCFEPHLVGANRVFHIPHDFTMTYEGPNEPLGGMDFGEYNFIDEQDYFGNPLVRLREGPAIYLDGLTWQLLRVVSITTSAGHTVRPNRISDITEFMHNHNITYKQLFQGSTIEVPGDPVMLYHNAFRVAFNMVSELLLTTCCECPCYPKTNGSHWPIDHSNPLGNWLKKSFKFP